MTKKEILALPRLETDEQLDEAIAYLDEHLFNPKDDLNGPEVEKLTELIWEYEERTDILNR